MQCSNGIISIDTIHRYKLANYAFHTCSYTISRQFPIYSITKG